jgi:hypothetical protein
LLFRGSRDGWSAKIIHSKIDGQGPTITIIKTQKGKIFGGFASVSWESNATKHYYNGSAYVEHSKNYKPDKNTFLFSVDLAIKNSRNLSEEYGYIVCRSDYGPIFGDHDLYVPADANTGKSSGF